MKLEDFSRAHALVAKRNYLDSVKGCMSHRQKMKIGNIDIMPDLVDAMLPEMRSVVDQQIAVVDQKLAEIGVTVE